VIERRGGGKRAYAKPVVKVRRKGDFIQSLELARGGKTRRPLRKRKGGKAALVGAMKRSKHTTQKKKTRKIRLRGAALWAR